MKKEDLERAKKLVDKINQKEQQLEMLNNGMTTGGNGISEIVTIVKGRKDDGKWIELYCVDFLPKETMIALIKGQLENELKELKKELDAI